MACSSCKGGVASTAPKEIPVYSTGVIIKNYIVKTLIFLVMMVLMPIIVLVITYVLFKNIVLSQDVDILPLLRQYIGKMDKKRKDYEDDDDTDEPEIYQDEDYELVNVEKIN